MFLVSLYSYLLLVLIKLKPIISNLSEIASRHVGVISVFILIQMIMTVRLPYIMEELKYGTKL